MSAYRIAQLGAALPSAGLAAWFWAVHRNAPAPEQLDVFWRLFVFDDATAAWLFVPIVALACVAPVQRAALRFAGALGEHPNRTAVVSFAAFAFAARFVHQAHPLSLDEYAGVFQSELFANGRLFAQAPPPLLPFLLPRDMQQFFFSVSHETGAIASGYWPGFALLLAPFSALGVPWLLNPLIGAVTLRALHRVALTSFGSRELAGLALLIALGSTALTINAASFYAMPAHALANLAFAALLAEPTQRRALAAGLCGGFALALHNPLPHALFAAPWIVWLALGAERRRALPALALGYLPLALLLGVGWSALLARELAESAGTAARAGELSAFLSLPNAAIVVARIAGFVKLWLWAAPAALVLALLGLRAARRDARLAAWAASAALTALAYFFVPFDQGHGWGYRYFHSAWLALPLLAVSAVHVWRDSAHARELAGFAAACALASLAVLTPLRALQCHGFIVRHLAQLPRAPSGTPELVLVDAATGYYTIDLIQNDPLFARRPLVMEHLGAAANAQMRRRFFPDLVLLARDERGEVWGRR
ncbi:MAG TPA: hypothetical protein VFT98_12915 [Myxococcota bacterium]|nr:hypothetical protein [Myxococcota bacterium]